MPYEMLPVAQFPPNDKEQQEFLSSKREGAKETNV
jgi:hypothetical protein